MESILVTGGTGFIGSHTCLSLLEAGFNIVIVDSNINSSPLVIERLERIFKKNFVSEKRINFFKGDIRNEKFLEEVFISSSQNCKPIGAVIHFAGLKAVGESVAFPIKYWDANVNGSICLLKVMERNNCKTIVFSSSATIYGEGSSLPLLEISKIKPKNPYGYTKASVECILENIFESDKNNWKIINLRYFNPIGAHHSGLLGEDPKDEPNNLFPYLCKVASGQYKKLKIFGSNWPTPDGTGIRDYIHIMDLAEAHTSALNFLIENKPQFRNINIGTGKGTSVLELLMTFKKVNNCEIPYVFVDRRKGDVPILVANNQLAISLLNWKPKRTLADMCIDGWNWQKNNPNGYSIF